MTNTIKSPTAGRESGALRRGGASVPRLFVCGHDPDAPHVAFWVTITGALLVALILMGVI